MPRFIAISLVFVLVGCGTPSAGNVDLARLENADREPGQWLGLGGTYRGDRFSPLEGIDESNAATLGFAWEYDASSRRGRVERGQEATPIMVDGVLYLAGPWGSVAAVDARTGQERWRYDPDVDGSYARRACCDAVNRGLQVWRGKIYIGTLDGYLVALDAETGRELWKRDTFVDRDTRSYTITGPPQVAKNVVVIGNSGGEFGVRGYITAYDVETGEQRWRFFVVPGDPAKGPAEHPEMARALETWGPDTDWQSGLGGTVWGEMNYDPELDLLYVGTGNSTPYSGWYRDPSGGDNLYLVSILAIDPDDGKLAWHYQQVPWELWDYTATQNMILADLTIDGTPRKVIMQAPKNGIFYVLDRQTGAFISGTPFVRANWLTGFDSTGRPRINPAAIYQDKPAVVFPSQVGAHNWQPMAFSRQTGLVYIPARESGMIMMDEPGYTWKQGTGNVGSGALFDLVLGLAPSVRPLYDELLKATPDAPPLGVSEFLLAWDPVARQERWRVPLANTTYAGGGVLTTAGNLVIQGTSDGRLVVYSASSGEKRTEIKVGTAIMAAPMTYQLDGEQYVVVAAGFGGAVGRQYPYGTAGYTYQNAGRLLAFKLGGGPTPLPPAYVPLTTPEPPARPPVAAAVLVQGEVLFDAHCITCHGAREDRISAFPDLRRMSEATHSVFDAIVRHGSLAAGGMAGFADILSVEDVSAIHEYLIQQQRLLRQQEARGQSR